MPEVMEVPTDQIPPSDNPIVGDQAPEPQEQPADRMEGFPEPVPVETTTPETDVTETESGDTPADAQSAEGPTPIMLAVARQFGLPDDLINAASNDADLDKAVNWFKDYQGQQQKEPPAAAPAQDPANEEPVAQAEELMAKLLLSEEEFDADDPVRKQIEHLVNVVNERNARDSKAIETFSAFANQYLDADAAKTKEADRVNYQQPFDKGLDSLNSQELGNSEKGLTDIEAAKRLEIFNQYASLSQYNPSGDKTELAIKVANMMVKDLKIPPTVKERIQNQQGFLGTGSGTNDPATNLSRVEEFQRYLDSG